MKLKLPDSVTSPQDLTSLIIELREYARWFSHESIKKRVNKTAKQEAPLLTPAAAELVRQVEAKKSYDRSDIDDIIDTLTHIKDSAPTMTITLAAPPTTDVKQSLANWSRAHIAPNVLINFQFNRTLLGGMVVRSGSHIFDWSFRRQILNAPVSFAEVLRRV